MTSAREHLPNRVTRGYRAVALRFCESLIKDRADAEEIVDAVFREWAECKPVLQPGQTWESYLFVQLRDRCFDYLKTASKTQLLRASGSEKLSRYSESASARQPVGLLSLFNFFL
ncbi:hypothetical protein ACO2Q8_04335 [Larkinella sp. VNQ87]|uniref:hypothetical protein n=1 Tax=Larkinella sp. VNQ87 TaxID=3400921 RepID=UPI003BFDE61C